MGLTVTTVATTGVGRPDYSSEIDRVKRGETYYEFKPRDSEKYKIFMLSMRAGDAFPNSPLAIGETRHFVDIETGLATPYSHPSGISSDLREWLMSCGSLNGITTWLDGDIKAYFISQIPCFFQHQYEQLVWLNTVFWDPNRAKSHTWDFTLTNLSALAITGMVHVSIVLA